MGRVGVWLIGARGSIATLTIASQIAIHRGLAGTIGMVTERPEFQSVDLTSINDMVFGGHDIRDINLLKSAKHILPACGVHHLYDQIVCDLEAVDRNIRPGIVRSCGPSIDSIANHTAETSSDLEAIRLVRKDLDAFKIEKSIDHLVVVNIASTEQTVQPNVAWEHLVDLKEALFDGSSILPSSSLYAYAALSGGDAFVNFTPSLGSRIGALEELAEECGAVHAGSDGKTGETLIKSVLVELFLRRNLRVLSWFGENILGNDDGRVLLDPLHKATKIRTKDQLLKKILEYPLETAVNIDFVESLGEWKIAWDYVHFEGFLGSKMNLQFTWSGCDSLLAAPLVLDLVRLCEFAQRRKERGILTTLSPFFKDPMGLNEQRFISQDETLLTWIKSNI